LDGMRVGQGGAGPGPHTPDSSAVELYELAPARRRPTWVRARPS
jgi:hypothetical protein